MSNFDPTQVDLSGEITVFKCKGIVTSTGAGKSTTIRSAIDAALRSVSNGVVVIFLPTVKLGKEQLQELKLSLSHYVVEQYLGLEQPDPNAPKQKMCPRKKVPALIKLGVPLKALCGNGKGYCQHHQAFSATPCGYSVQATKTPDIWVMSHASLFQKRPEFMQQPVLKVIDESFFNVSFSEVSLDIDDLIDPNAYCKGSCLKDLSHSIHRYLQSAPEGFLDADQLRHYVGDELVHGLDTVEKVKTHLQYNSSASDIQAAIASFKGGRSHALSTFWSLVAETPLEPMGRVPTIRKVRDTAKVEMRYSRGVHGSWESDTALLDATMPIQINRHFFENLTVIQNRTIEKHTSYLQISDSLLSKIMFTRTSSTYEHVLGLLKVRCSHIPGHHPVKVLLVTSKTDADEFKKRGLPAGVEMLTYGNVKGSNQYSNVPCIVLAGRLEMPVDAAERDSAILGGRLLSATYPSSYYYKRLVSVKGQSISAYYHPDPLTEELRRTVNEDELMQAIGRGRSIRRTYKNPLEVIVLTNVPLPLNEDLLTLTTWRGVQPTKLEVLLAEHGIVPLGMGEMQRHYPKVFTSNSVARTEKEKVASKYPELKLLLSKGTKVSAISSINIIYRQNHTYFAKPQALIRYTPEGKNASPVVAIVQKKESKSMQQQLDQLTSSKPLKAESKKQQKEQDLLVKGKVRVLGEDPSLLEAVVPEVTYKIVGVFVGEKRSMPDNPGRIQYYDPEDKIWTRAYSDQSVAECGIVNSKSYYFIKRN